MCQSYNVLESRLKTQSYFSRQIRLLCIDCKYKLQSASLLYNLRYKISKFSSQKIHNISISFVVFHIIILGGVCGRAVNTSNSGTGGPGFKSRPLSLAQGVASLDKELYSTLSLFSQVYKWVPASYCWGITLRWTSIPSRGD